MVQRGKERDMLDVPYKPYEAMMERVCPLHAQKEERSGHPWDLLNPSLSLGQGPNQCLERGKEKWLALVICMVVGLLLRT